MPLSFLLRRWAELQSTADADKHVQAIAALKGENIRYKTFATIPGGLQRLDAQRWETRHPRLSVLPLRQKVRPGKGPGRPAGLPEPVKKHRKRAGFHRLFFLSVFAEFREQQALVVL